VWLQSNAQRCRSTVIMMPVTPPRFRSTMNVKTWMWALVSLMSDATPVMVRPLQQLPV
jgi:hypothetical protein